MKRPLLIGVGTPFAGDDAVGRWIAAQLSGPQEFDVVESTGIALDLLAQFDHRERVLIIDACRSGVPVGTLHRINAHHDPLPAYMGQPSTHGMGVAEAVRLGETLGVLPKSLTIWAIEGVSFGLGSGMHPDVRKTAEQCVLECHAFLKG